MALFEILVEPVAGSKILELAEEQCDPVFTVLSRNLPPPPSQEEEVAGESVEAQPDVEMMVERVMNDLPEQLRRIVSSAVREVFSRPA